MKEDRSVNIFRWYATLPENIRKISEKPLALIGKFLIMYIPITKYLQNKHTQVIDFLYANNIVRKYNGKKKPKTLRNMQSLCEENYQTLPKDLKE